MTCDGCRFKSGAECRRHAPVMVPALGKTLFAFTDGSGCGDYEQTPKAVFLRNFDAPEPNE